MHDSRAPALVLALTLLAALLLYGVVLGDPLYSVVVLPACVGAYGLWRGRAWGLLALLLGAVSIAVPLFAARPWRSAAHLVGPYGLVGAQWGELSARPWDFLDEATWLAPLLLVVLVPIALYAARLFRRDAAAASIVTLIAVVLGLAVPVVAYSRPAAELFEDYQMWLGAREARRDVEAGRATLLGMGIGCGYGQEQARRLAAEGIRVRNVACCVLPRRLGARWLGYNEETRRLLDGRRYPGFVDSILRGPVWTE